MKFFGAERGEELYRKLISSGLLVYLPQENVYLLKPRPDLDPISEILEKVEKMEAKMDEILNFLKGIAQQLAQQLEPREQLKILLRKAQELVDEKGE